MNVDTGHIRVLEPDEELGQNEIEIPRDELPRIRKMNREARKRWAQKRIGMPDVPKHPRTAKEKQEARRRKRWRLEWLRLRGKRSKPGKIVTLKDKRRAAKLGQPAST